MKRFGLAVLVSAGLTVSLAAPTFAQWGRDRDPHYGRDPYISGDPYYGRGGSYGRGMDPVSVANRVMSDVDHVGMRAFSGGDRKHAENVRRELMQFQNRWHQGRFETKHLDRAIDSLKSLAGTSRIDPRSRQMLESDIYALRDLRASGGYGAYRGNGPYRGY
jgi:hypothetical protein